MEPQGLISGVEDEWRKPYTHASSVLLDRPADRNDRCPGSEQPAGLTGPLPALARCRVTIVYRDLGLTRCGETLNVMILPFADSHRSA